MGKINFGNIGFDISIGGFIGFFTLFIVGLFFQDGPKYESPDYYVKLKEFKMIWLTISTLPVIGMAIAMLLLILRDKSILKEL